MITLNNFHPDILQWNTSIKLSDGSVIYPFTTEERTSCILHVYDEIVEYSDLHQFINIPSYGQLGNTIESVCDHFSCASLSQFDKIFIDNHIPHSSMLTRLPHLKIWFVGILADIDNMAHLILRIID